MLFKHARDLFLRELLNLPTFRTSSEHIHTLTAEAHQPKLPELSAIQQECVFWLEREGVFTTDLTTLGLSSTEKLLHSAGELASKLDGWYPKEARYHDLQVPNKYILGFPDLFLWGLEEFLLDIVETYFAQPPFFVGASLRRSLAHSTDVKVRRWHLDHEDHRVIKIILYLNEVDEQSGPFQCISRRSSAFLQRKLNYRHGTVSEEAIQALIPEKFWRSSCGPAGTVTFVDTASVFHRGKMPIACDRTALFYTYTSRHPRNPHVCGSLFDRDELEFLAQPLSERQRDCVLWELPTVMTGRIFPAIYTDQNSLST